MTAAQCIQLKQKIRTELARRNGYNSISSSASSVDSTFRTPVEGQKTYTNTGKALIDNFLQITDYGDLKKVQENDPIPNSFCMSKLGEKVKQLSDMPKTGETTATHSLPGHGSLVVETQSGCRGACTGLCIGTCHGNCNSCTSCQNGCTGCSGCQSCSGTCSQTCTSCHGSCDAGCTSCTGCANSCTTSCKGCSGCTGTAVSQGSLT